MNKTPYTHDNADLVFSIAPTKNRAEYWRKYNAKRKVIKKTRIENIQQDKPKEPDEHKIDKRFFHRPSKHDSAFNCPVHGHPLKRYEINKKRFRGYDAEGNAIQKGNVFYRCHHCLHAGLKPSYYPENYFNQTLA